MTLLSDADFASGSKLVLTNGTLVYTPGLVTQNTAVSDKLGYTVTDTVTGAITKVTQTVTLSDGPPPLVTLALAPSASNVATAMLGTVAPGVGRSGDGLSVSLLSDTRFATGSGAQWHAQPAAP